MVADNQGGQHQGGVSQSHRPIFRNVRYGNLGSTHAGNARADEPFATRQLMAANRRFGSKPEILRTSKFPSLFLEKRTLAGCTGA
jgi:hypothetical protein